MIIHPSDVHSDTDKARLGVGLAAEALGIVCNLRLQTQWLVKIDGNELETFLELARECAEKGEA
jgi:hypothetical protein